MNPGCQTAQRPVYSSQQEKERAVYANKIYCLLCKDNGIRPCSWNQSPAWTEYVDGKIDEQELLTRAEAEVNDFQGEFSEPEIVKEEQTGGPNLARAKLANKVYSQLCAGSGLNFCFFKNFPAWSDFVNERIDEDQFIEMARAELLKIKEDNENRTE